MDLLMQLKAIVQTTRGVSGTRRSIGLRFLLMKLLDLDGDTLIERAMRVALLLDNLRTSTLSNAK